MEQPTRFIGMDVHKDTIAVAVTAAGDAGKATAYGTIPNTAAALERLVERLHQAGGGSLKFCYNALAVLHRGGLLTAVWVPDAAHEAMRDLIRSRLAAVRAVRTARQQLSAFLLRHERIYRNGGKAWTKAHRGWLADQSFAQPAQQIVLEESIEAVRLGEHRRDRVDGFLRAQIPSWSLFPLVQNLGALRGLDTIASAGLAAAIGDPSRFASAPDFMAYLGLVPSEHSSGLKRRIGAITKSGDIHARTLLIEAAHSYRFPARITRRQLAGAETVPQPVREIAWKAQTRLCQRYRRMVAKDKPTPVIVTAIARELAGFVWSIACVTSDPPAKTSAATTTSDEVCPTESTGRSALRRRALKAAERRTARPEQTGAPIELRYVTVDRSHPEADNPKVRTPASRTRGSATASAQGKAG
jgi:transposase